MLGMVPSEVQDIVFGFIELHEVELLSVHPSSLVPKRITDGEVVFKYDFPSNFTILSSRLCLPYLCICYLLLFLFLRSATLPQ